ncbi:MAG: hypothetical protein DRN78_03410 [Thermoproteota archaeon]|nr:MAG: hypothetical protein DRN78_03410 [Candidatus Korarchaeota archaeon]
MSKTATERATIVLIMLHVVSGEAYLISIRKVRAISNDTSSKIHPISGPGEHRSKDPLMEEN